MRAIRSVEHGPGNLTSYSGADRHPREADPCLRGAGARTGRATAARRPRPGDEPVLPTRRGAGRRARGRRRGRPRHGVHARSTRGGGRAARGRRVGYRERGHRRGRARHRSQRSQGPTPSRPRAHSRPRSSTKAPFDLVLLGRNSVDADTGQVGPELAELLDLPFATGVRSPEHEGPDSAPTLRARRRMGAARGRPPRRGLVRGAAHRPVQGAARGARRRSTRRASARSPPRTSPVAPGATVPGEPTAARPGSAPCGVHGVERARTVLTGPIDEQVRAAVDAAASPAKRSPTRSRRRTPSSGSPTRRAGGRTRHRRGARARSSAPRHASSSAPRHGSQPGSAGRSPRSRSRTPLPEVARLLGCRRRPRSWWAAMGTGPSSRSTSSRRTSPTLVADWAGDEVAWGLFAPSTAWGREVAARAAARLGAGLTGDAVDVEVADGRLVAWKPAFGGQLVAAITADSAVQMATVRAGNARPRSRPGRRPRRCEPST